MKNIVATIVLVIIAAAVVTLMITYTSVLVMVIAKTALAMVLLSLMYWVGRYFMPHIRSIHNAWLVLFAGWVQRLDDLYADIVSDGY